MSPDPQPALLNQGENLLTPLKDGIFKETPLEAPPFWLAGLDLGASASHRGGVVSVYPVDETGVAALSIGVDGEVILWNVRTGNSILFGDLESKVLVTALDAGSGYLAVVPQITATNRNVRIWSLRERRYIKELDRLHSRVTSVDFQPDRSFIGKGEAAVAIGGADGRVYRWRFFESHQNRILSKASKDFERYVGHATVVSAVAFHPGGRVFFSGDWNGAFNAWLSFDTDLHGGKYDENLFGRGFFTEQSTRKRAKRDGTDPIEKIAIDSRGRHIALGLQNGRIEVWEARGLAWQGSYLAHAGAMRALHFNPDGDAIASYGRGDKLSIWKFSFLEEGIEQRRKIEFEKYLELPIPDITDFRYLKPGVIVAGTSDGKVLEIDIELAKRQASAASSDAGLQEED
jgi:WD40 repeat protein